MGLLNGMNEEARRARVRRTIGLNDQQRAVKVESESAKTLRDLASLQYDFELSSRFFLQYAEIPDEERDPEAAHQALWIAGVTMYGRAFSKGVRHSARARAEIYSAEQTIAHEFILASRNKFVAHSVNGFEHGNVFAIIEGSTAMDLAVAGVGTQHTRLASLRGSKAHELASLCRVQMSDLTNRSNEVQRIIANELVEQGAAFVLGLEELGMPDIDESRAARDRSRL